ncbi:hypothetical protein GpartN1_g3995.t1 [Galdieria partita]|uniref:Uncharacterized protein n=1 Tax=Galdieria partita TaxID=83374 RepID=A0A9C7UQQ4_9RHOD|nr:hypothetical protein GpartN1_g3995.t1 [Galdieria partita]
MIFPEESLLEIPSVSSCFVRNAIQSVPFNSSYFICVPTVSYVLILEVTTTSKLQGNCSIRNSWKVDIGLVSCVAFHQNGQLLVLARETQLLVLRLVEQEWKQIFLRDMRFYPRAITIVDRDKYRLDILVSGACGVVIVSCNPANQEKLLINLLEGTAGHCCCCLVSLNSSLVAAATTDGRAAVWLREEKTPDWKPVASLMPLHEAVTLAACDRIVDIGLYYREENNHYFLALGWWNGAVLVYTCPKDSTSYKLQWSREACSNCHSWKDIPCGYLTWHVSGQQLIVCTEPFRISILDAWNGSVIRTLFVPSHFLCQGVSICNEYLLLLSKNICHSKWSVLHYCHVGGQTCRAQTDEFQT